jgi:hypothetical protein
MLSVNLLPLSELFLALAKAVRSRPLLVGAAGQSLKGIPGDTSVHRKSGGSSVVQRESPAVAGYAPC